MVDIAPQLKRKREEAAAQKKAKKQRKDEAAAALENDRNDQAGNPVTNSTPKSKNSPTPKKQSNATPKTNGVSKNAASETPMTALKVEKSPAQQNGSVNGDEQDAATATQTPSKAPNGIVEEVAQLDNSEAQGTPKAGEKAERKKKEKKRKDKAKRDELINTELSVQATKGRRPDRYITSASQGGWFLPADPIFSTDEKYLLVADSKSLHVYSTETSLLAHTLFEEDVGPVTAYALSATSPHLIYVAYSVGQIIKWDWVTARKIGRWDVGAKVQNMAVIIQPESEDDFVYCHEADDGHSVCIRALRTRRQTSEREQRSELKQLLNTSSPIRGIRVVLQGKYVIVATVDSITIGKRIKTSRTALEEFEYLWREFKLSKHITTFDVYHREQQETNNGKKAASDQQDILDIAIGDDTGVIMLFEDILASIAAIESSQKGKKDRADSAESLRPKRLHWHRDTVGSVKWSSDGMLLLTTGKTNTNPWKATISFPVATRQSLRSGSLPRAYHSTYPIFLPLLRTS